MVRADLAVCVKNLDSGVRRLCNQGFFAFSSNVTAGGQNKEDGTVEGLGGSGELGTPTYPYEVLLLLISTLALFFLPFLFHGMGGKQHMARVFIKLFQYKQ